MGNKKWQEWIAGLRSGERLPKKNQLLILLLVGVLLLVIIIPVPGGSEGDTADSGIFGTGSADVGSGSSDSEEASALAGLTDLGEYEAYLEQKTAQTLREVEGVGEVTVMITLKSDGQRIVEKDQSSTSQTTEEADSEGGTRTTEDQSSDKSSIYSQGSDGSSTPYVSKSLSPEIEGVVVIAEGGDNAVVTQNITEAVQALFGVEAHKIKIMKRASYIEGGVEN